MLEWTSVRHLFATVYDTLNYDFRKSAVPNMDFPFGPENGVGKGILTDDFASRKRRLGV